jgi:hypothetical protein
MLRAVDAASASTGRASPALSRSDTCVSYLRFFRYLRVVNLSVIEAKSA